MKGLIRRAVMLGCTLALGGLGCGTLPQTCSQDTGCGATCNGQLYDRCYPQRYNNLAIRSVNRTLAPQVQNGHVLDQTVWNHFFEPGTDKLTPGGQDQLAYLARRRPAPDRTLYLASAMDLGYDPACPERFGAARQELDGLRVQSVQKYLTALNAGRPHEFQVLVHDPGDVTLRSLPIGSSIQQMYGRFRGGVGAVGGGGAGGGGGGGGGTAGPTGSGTGGR